MPLPGVPLRKGAKTWRHWDAGAEERPGEDRLRGQLCRPRRGLRRKAPAETLTLDFRLWSCEKIRVPGLGFLLRGVLGN